MERDPSSGREALPVPERTNGRAASPVDVRRAPEPTGADAYDDLQGRARAALAQR